MSLDSIVLKGTAAVALAVALVGCGGDDPAPVAGEMPPEMTSDLTIPSARPRVRPKHGERYVQDLASGLGIARDEACLELGLYDCVSEAHRIVVGGVEPYEQQIDEPLPVAPATAPIAYDRIALSACSVRADRDFDAPEDAQIFGAVAGGDASIDNLRIAVVKLYDRVLRRDADQTEVDALVSFYEDVQDEADPAAAPREWAVMACFAVATTQEALFY